MTDWHIVQSSAMNRIGYDKITAQLHIEFKGSDIYTFCRVPESLFVQFLHASSKGTFYDRYIRDKFHC